MEENAKSALRKHNITEVTSVISHQLKTPLAGIKSSLEILLSGDLGALTPSQKEYAALALGSVEKMIVLVKNLLDASRIDENRMQFTVQEFDIVQITQSVIKELSSFAQAKNTTITLEASSAIPKLVADAIKIQQVINNLVVNAIRYSRGKGEVKIKISHSGKEVTFSCADNGIGISDEDSKKLFSKFYRSPRVVGLAPDGSGLGLYISKAIIEQSGGKIWFESAVDKGATFSFTLPVQ